MTTCVRNRMRRSLSGTGRCSPVQGQRQLRTFFAGGAMAMRRSDRGCLKLMVGVGGSLRLRFDLCR